MSKHLSPEIRVPIDTGNPSIQRNEDLCIRCGQCRDVCRDYAAVLTYYDLARTGDEAICIGCGQCANVCPTASITETFEYQDVQKAIADPDKIVILSTSPSVRVALGEQFGMEPGAFVAGQMVALAKALGFDYVLDTNFAADMTIVEEASELISRLTKKDRALPQFTSCCPAWVKFAETYYPHLLPHISTAKSPIGMQGPTIKTYFAKKMGLDPKKIVNVALTPCTAKKFEIRREEMNAAGRYGNDPDMRDMDHVITTREFSRWALEAHVNFHTLPDTPFDRFMGEASGAGVIFGNTGGVMEAALRTAYEYITGKEAPASLCHLEAVRGYDSFRKAVVPITDDLSVRVAVLYGTGEVRKFLDRENLADYDFVEVMTCPGGCIGGGGQPKWDADERDRMRKARIDGLYRKDADMDEKVSNRNTELTAMYEEFYGEPLSELAEQLLHTSYHDRSADLGEPVETYQHYKEYEEIPAPAGKRRWKCRVCGYIYEGDEPPAECPICHKDASFFEEI